MLKILQARLQQYVNGELPPDVQAEFREDRGTRDQMANICWIIETAIDFQNNICFCFIDYIKAFDSVDQNKLENSLALHFLEIRNKADLFHSCGHCGDFQICWHIE